MTEVWPVIATRGRPEWVERQLDALVPQLQGGERIVLVVDGCPQTEAMLKKTRGEAPLTVVALRDCVGADRARIIGTAQVPSKAVVCEIDDHDIAEPTLLNELRMAFFPPGVWIVHCDAYLADPGREVVKERRQPRRGPFAETGMGAAWGMKAYRKAAYDLVGGRPEEYFPANDYALLCMLEQLGGKGCSLHIDKFLVTVTEDCRGISAQHKAEQQRQVERVATIAMNGGFKLPFSPAAPVVVCADSKPDHSETLRPRKREPVAGRTPVAGTRRKPRALLVTRLLGAGYGGGELSLLNMTRFLAEAAGYEVQVAYNADAGAEPYVADWIGQAVQVSRDELQNDPDALLKRFRPDVVIVNGNDHKWLSDAAARACTPIVAVVQFWRNILKRCDEAGYAALYQEHIPAELLDQRGLRQFRLADALIANSEWTASVVRRAVGREPDAIVHPPINRERVEVTSPGALPVHERPSILCTSVQEGKGSRIFLDLAERNPHLRFRLMVGDNRHLKQPDIIARAEALPNVRVEREWVTGMAAIYAETRCVFIGTQTCESFCRGAAEARLNGIPLLTSDAGNLRNINGAGAGVIVPHDAPIERWNAALHECLALRPEPTDAHCHDDRRAFAEAVTAVRLFSDVAFLVPNAPGVSAAAREFNSVLGVECLAWGTRMDELAGYALTIVPGRYREALARQHRGPLAFLWCSHAAQMDSSRGEVADLGRVLAHVAGNTRRWLLMTSAPDVAVLRRTYGRKVFHLPNVYQVPPPILGAKLEGPHVFVPGPYVARKNVFAALAAVREAECEAHVTDWIDRQAPEARGWADALGLTMHVHTCSTVPAVRAVAAQCGAGLVVSTAETWSYAGAECVSAGTPVTAWCGVPACRDFRHNTLDPTNPVLTAAALRRLMEDPAAAQTQYDQLAQRARGRALVARRTLLTMLEESNG